MTDPVRIEFESIGGDKLLKTIKQLQDDLKATAEVQAKLAKNSSGFTNLAKSLNLTYKEAQKLSEAIGLTGEEILGTIAKIRSLQSVGASTQEIFNALNKEAGITAAQFLVLDKAVGALNATQEATEEVARRSAEALRDQAVALEQISSTANLASSLGKSFQEAKNLASSLGLTASEAGQAIARLKQLQSVNASSDVQFEALNKELGITAEQFKKLEKASRSFSDSQQGFAGGAISRVTALANTYNEVSMALQGVLAAGAPVYQALIGANEELNQQILSSQASLAATQRVFQNGIEITDPKVAIEALGEPIRAALQNIREESLNLVGVTSQELVPLFQILTTNASKLSNQSKEFPDAIGAAEKLTTDFAAALGTLSIPLNQAQEEINSILQGQISVDSRLAKSIGLNNEQVKLWQQQGVLVDKLREKLEPFVAGNQLAAQSIGGISSNIQEIVQETARVAGEPLFEILTQELQQVYELLQDNKDEIEAFAKEAVTQIINLFNSFKEIGESLKGLEPEFQTLGENGARTSELLVTGFRAFAGALTVVAKIIAPILNKLLKVQSFALTVIEKAQTGVGFLTGSFDSATEAVLALNQATFRLGGESVTALENIRKAEEARQQAQKNGVKLTDEQIRAEQEALNSAKRQIDANEKQIAALKALAPQSEDQKRAIQEQIAGLEALNAKLSTNSGELSKQSGGLTLVASAQQQQQESLNKLTKAYDESTRKISEAEAQKNLEIAKLQESGKIGAQEAEKKQLEATQARIASQIEAERAKLTELEKLDQTNEDIAKQTSDSRVKLAELETQKLENEIKTRENLEEAGRKKLEDDYEASSLKIQQTEADRLKEIERLESQGVLNDAQAQDRKLQVTLDRINSELDAEKKKLSALEALPTSGDPEAERKKANEISQLRIEIAKKEAEQLQAIREKEDAAREAALKDIEKQFSRVTEAAKAAETDRLIQIQQLLNARQITEERANALRVSATKETIAQELDAEKAKLEELRSLPLPTDPDSREKAEQEIRDSIQRTADLSLQLLQAEKDARDALIEEQKKQIQDAADAENRAITDANRGLEAKKNAVDAVTRSLQQQNTLLSAQFDLENAIAELTRTETQIRLDRTERALEISRQLNDDQAEGSRERLQLERELEALGFSRNSNEEQILRRRQEIERAIAEENIANVRREFDQKRQLLQLDLEQQRIALRRSEIEARIAENQARQAVNTAQSNLSQAQLTGDQNAIAAAQQDVNLAQDSLQLAQENTAATREQVQNFDQIASSQLRILDIQQQSALALARQANEAERYATALERAQAADRRGGGGSIPGRRTGGTVEAGKPYYVGEAGTELFVPSTSGYVINHKQAMDLARASITRPTIASPAASSYTGDRALLKEVQALRKEISNMRPIQTNQIKVEGGSNPGATVSDFLEQQRRNLFRNS